jgi:hypothetical protein
MANETLIDYRLMEGQLNEKKENLYKLISVIIKPRKMILIYVYSNFIILMANQCFGFGTITIASHEKEMQKNKFDTNRSQILLDNFTMFI